MRTSRQSGFGRLSSKNRIVRNDVRVSFHAPFRRRRTGCFAQVSSSLVSFSPPVHRPAHVRFFVSRTTSHPYAPCGPWSVQSSPLQLRVRRRSATSVFGVGGVSTSKFQVNWFFSLGCKAPIRSSEERNHLGLLEHGKVEKVPCQGKDAPIQRFKETTQQARFRDACPNRAKRGNPWKKNKKPIHLRQGRHANPRDVGKSHIHVELQCFVREQPIRCRQLPIIVHRTEHEAYSLHQRVGQWGAMVQVVSDDDLHMSSL